MRKTKTKFIGLALFTSCVAWAGQEIEFPQFDKELVANGVFSSTTSPHVDLEIMTNLLQSEILKIRSAQSNLEKKDLARLKAVEDKVSEYRKIDTDDLGKLTAALRESKSLLYSLRSHEAGAQSNVSLLSRILNFLDNGSVDISYQDSTKPLDAKAAKKEAYNLVDPKTENEYLHPSELEGLSPEQVSQLDVRADHPLWYTQKELEIIKQKYGSAWNYFIKKMEEETTKEKKLDKTYNLDQARRVLEFSKNKDSATSAKIEAKDAFGMTWKIKWSEEIQSEPIANQLYMNLGGKFTDIVYANAGGADDLILVLSEKDSADCSSVASIEKLKSCLLNGEYKFDLTPFIVESGVITEEKIKSLGQLKKLSAKKQKSYLGRQYIVFNESLVEFKPAHSLELGAVSFNVGGAIEDRAKRGLVILNYWLQNKDAKDENNSGVLVNGEYLEYMHDLGASLANIWNSARVNDIKPDFADIKTTAIVQGPKGPLVKKIDPYIHIPQWVLYLPVSYEAATQADALWMAKKIANLTVAEIEEVVSSSNWPPFLQHVMTNRLIARRNDIVKVFNIGSDLPLMQPNLTKGIPLDTRKNRETAARYTGLTLITKGDASKAADLIEKNMKQAGIKFNKWNDTGYTDLIYSSDKKGVLSLKSCKESVIIGTLESTIRPAGLDRRMKRGKDDKPLSLCLPDFSSQPQNY